MNVLQKQSGRIVIRPLGDAAKSSRKVVQVGRDVRD
jgi:hypothetical protein